MKTRLVQKVFVFLLITVGILFVLMRIQKATKEPFVSPDRVGRCSQDLAACGSKQLSDGKNVYLCDTEDRALNILECDDDVSDLLSPDNVKLLGLSDAVCYVKKIDNRDVYICHNRPPPRVYEPPPVDAMILQSPYDDMVPSQLEDILPPTCDTYQTITAQVFRNFSTMTLNKNKVDSGLGIIQNVRTEMSNLYTRHCVPMPTLESKRAACEHILQFNTDASTIQNVNSLQQIQTGVIQSLSTMRGYYQNDIVGGYSGLGCPEPKLVKPAGL